MVFQRWKWVVEGHYIIYIERERWDIIEECSLDSVQSKSWTIIIIGSPSPVMGQSPAAIPCYSLLFPAIPCYSLLLEGDYDDYIHVLSGIVALL